MRGWLARALVALSLPAGRALSLSSQPPTPSNFGVRTLGVDFGLRCCGVAISSGFAPLPLRVMRCGGDSVEEFEEVAKACARICAGEGADQVILGMPYNSSGGEGEQANSTRVFASMLADAVYPRPVFLWDERFSSQVASMRMNKGKGATRGERVDAVAAAVILEDFFNAPEDASALAPHVPSTLSWADGDGSGAPRPKVKLATPPSQSEVRRAMMERAAETERKQRESSQRGKASRAQQRAAAPGAKGTSSTTCTSDSSRRTRPKRTAERKIDRFSID